MGVAVDTVGRAAARWLDLRPGLGVRPMLVVGRLQRLWVLWDARLRPTFADAGLQAGDFDALAALRRAGTAVAPGELARTMLVTAGATSKRVDRLVEASLAERVASANDGRQRLVQLTPEGARQADRLMTAHLQAQDRLLTPLTPDECQQLEVLLIKLLAAADESEQDQSSAAG